MKLYEFTLEIQDGEHEYTLSRYVAANTPNAAARYAKQNAQNFHLNARYDSHTDWYEAPIGFPIWRIGTIREINEIMVPAADGTSIVTFTVNQLYRTDGSQPRLRIVRPNHESKPHPA